MLDDPRFESQQEQEIASSPQLSRPALGPTQPPVQWVMHPFLRVKLQGMGWPQMPWSATGKNEQSYAPSHQMWLYSMDFGRLYLLFRII